MPASSKTPPPRDWIRALILGAAATLLYLLTHQHRFYNDGIFFERKLRTGGEELLYNHILYLPLTRLFQIVVGWVEPIANETAMRSVAALAGGLGVGLVFLVLRSARISPTLATAGATLFAGLTSIWFHSTATELHSVQAACATVFLLGLVRVIAAPTTPPRRSTSALLFAGASLAPAAHVSGMCIGLPAAVAWWLAPAARRRLFWATAAGIGLFVAAYLGVMSQNAGFAGYTDAHTGKYSVLWTRPGMLPTLFSIGLAEATLYALPAATLAAAGLRILFRTDRRLGWVCLAWLAAWPLVAWPVGDRMFGAYYTPTTPVLALLAVLAATGLARSPARALGVCALASLPIAAVLASIAAGLDGELIGGASVVITAAAAWTWARPLANLPGDPAGDPSGSRGSHPGRHPSGAAPIAAGFGLAVLAITLTGSHIRNIRTLDVERTRIRRVHAAINSGDASTALAPLLVYLAENAATDEHWKLFFPGADGDEECAFNPIRLGYVLDPAEATRVRETFVDTVRTALAAQRPVFLEGSISRAMQVAPRNTELTAFFAALTSFATLAPTTTEGLLRIVPK